VTGAVVLDASAVVRAVMDAGAQPALLGRIGEATTAIAPTLLCAQVGNTLWKYTRIGVMAPSDLPDRHREAMALVQLFVDDADLFPEVLTLAATQNHPVYDALYALTAKRHAAVLLTFDRRLHGLCESERIESTLFAAG
jgi:predicted nucleic acid-binding protein